MTRWLVEAGARVTVTDTADADALADSLAQIADLSVEYGKPIGLGITGPGMSRLQAEARINRAKSAVEAVVKLEKAVSDL